MKKKITTLIIFILFSITLTGCTSNNPLAGLEYINEDYGFGLNPPDGWVMNETSADNYIVKFNTSDENNFPVALIIIISDYGDGDTLESHAEWEIDIFENASEEFTLLSNNNRVINNINAYEIVYTDKVVLFGYTIKTKEVLVDLDNYVLTLAFYASSDSYDAYLSDFEDAVNTFAIDG